MAKRNCLRNDETPEGDTPRQRAVTIHSLRVEGDVRFFSNFYPKYISIHSLRVEGDVQFKVFPLQVIQFQSTPSVWRETVMHIFGNMLPCLFQSTPSVWRETPILRKDKVPDTFQSTPSVWRETATKMDAYTSRSISIHSLRVEGDSYITNDS